MAGDWMVVTPPSTSFTPAEAPARRAVTRSFTPLVVVPSCLASAGVGGLGIAALPQPGGGGVGAARVARPALVGLEVVLEHDRDRRRRRAALGDVAGDHQREGLRAVRHVERGHGHGVGAGGRRGEQHLLQRVAPVGRAAGRPTRRPRTRCRGRCPPGPVTSRSRSLLMCGLAAGVDGKSVHASVALSGSPAATVNVNVRVSFDRPRREGGRVVLHPQLPRLAGEEERVLQQHPAPALAVGGDGGGAGHGRGRVDQRGLEQRGRGREAVRPVTAAPVGYQPSV